MADKTVRTRYAPSPTGFMHVGNLRTALYEYLVAKSQGGKFVLRIEDTDRERLVEGAVDVIYHTLELAGLKHDEGPDIGGSFGPYVQSERKDMYLPYAEQLIQEALETLMRGRTTIMVAHRLSTIRGCGRILYLENGKILEEGTYEDLMAKKGRFADMVAHQLTDQA